jgi:hypothetical protein
MFSADHERMRKPAPGRWPLQPCLDFADLSQWRASSCQVVCRLLRPVPWPKGESSSHCVVLARVGISSLPKAVNRGRNVRQGLPCDELTLKTYPNARSCTCHPGQDAPGAPARVYERINDRWEVCMSPTDGQAQQVSFVNSICTSKGGTHVNYLVDQIVKCVFRFCARRH